MPKEQWIQGDLVDAEKLASACEGVNTVFHLANIAHVNVADTSELRRINVLGTSQLKAACLAAKVPNLVYFSSVLAADPESSAYAGSKLEAEKVLLERDKESDSHLHVSILRPVNVYGPGMKGNIAGLIKRIRDGRLPPLPKLDNRLALISVDDLCRAAMLVSQGAHESHQIFTICDGQAYTPNIVEQAIYDALERKKPSWRTPRMVFYAASLGAQLAAKLGVWKNDLGLRTYRNLVADKPANCEKISTELGFEPLDTLATVMPRILKELH